MTLPETSTELAAWIQAVFSTLAIFTIFFASRQVRVARTQMNSAALQNAFQRLTSEEFSAERDYVKHRLLDDLTARGLPGNCAVSDMPVDMFTHIRTVSHYLDQLGVLVRQKYIDGDAVCSLMGAELQTLWLLLRPHIRAEREKRTKSTGKADHYQVFFEWLALTHGSRRQTSIIRKVQIETAKYTVET